MKWTKRDLSQHACPVIIQSLPRLAVLDVHTIRNSWLKFCPQFSAAAPNTWQLQGTYIQVKIVNDQSQNNWRKYNINMHMYSAFPFASNYENISVLRSIPKYLKSYSIQLYSTYIRISLYLSVFCRLSNCYIRIILKYMHTYGT